MKNILAQLALSARMFDQKNVQLILALASLVMLVLGTGAPVAEGGVGK